jgi:peptidyl-prolyl cis-trans isomerase B (cyclophilin B)
MKNVIFGLFCGSLLVLGVTPFVSGASILDQHDHRDLLVLIETRSGNFVIDFFHDDAPNHVENFLYLVDSGFYDGTFFHRIIEDFMIQGGDPKTIKTPEFDDINKLELGTLDYYSDAPASEWGTGGPDHQVNAEFNNIRHDRGIVSMARSQDPNSAGSQFFIVHQNSNFLDKEYTAFGVLVTEESLQTLDRIANLDVIGEAPENPEQARIIQATVMKRDFVVDYLENLLVERIPGDFKMETIDPTLPQPYTSERHGIKFLIPPGWNVQEPPKTHENSPDIVVLGPLTNRTFPDSLTVTIGNTEGKTFEQLKTEKINSLQPRIDDGSLDLKFTGANDVQGRDTYSIYAQGLFIKNSGDTFAPEETIDILFAEVLIYSTPKHYTFSTSSDDISGFDKQVQNLERAVHSFEILSDAPFEWENSIDLPKEGGGCLIATAAYGSEMAPQVQFLRELRDNTVLQTQVGANFMTEFNQFYYSFSPAVADYERENPMFKEAVKITLTPLLTSLAILNYVDIDTEQEMLGYGIGVILLNIGMYFVAPAAVIIAIKNRRK